MDQSNSPLQSPRGRLGSVTPKSYAAPALHLITGANALPKEPHKLLEKKYASAPRKPELVSPIDQVALMIKECSIFR